MSIEQVIGSLFELDFNKREINRLRTTVDAIRQYNHVSTDPTYIRERTKELKNYIKNSTNMAQALDEIKVEAFALVVHCVERVLGISLYDTQLLGGLVLHEGKIAEMNTGEGKTIVATLPSYLNALTGKGVHIITANDYLVQRDAEYLKPLYDYMGVSIGFITNKSSIVERKNNYQKDIVYVTSSEVGFDYLRDNTALSTESQVLREDFNYAIVDEVDYLLIDEASTPLILSGQGEESTPYYHLFNRFALSLKPHHYTCNIKENTIVLTEEGYDCLEQFIKQYNVCDVKELYKDKTELFYYINACLKAHFLYKKEKDYLVQSGQVQIVSGKTGRVLQGRRWSGGLHQAIEAKEGCKIQHESITLALITIQNFFCMYDKLSGMSGTASTQATEFQETYGLNIVTIPPHRPLRRKEHGDKLFVSKKAKLNYIVQCVKKCVAKNQPVLIGCSVISTSEELSSMLKLQRVKHNVLNAKHVAKEAQIIANAGYPGAVTIATNMAGRGTDILLGGAETHLAKQQQVIDSGGLMVIIAERHKTRRIDDQLKGRCARQGDPGECLFALSLEDEFLTHFGGERFRELKEEILSEGTAPEEEELNLPFLSSIISYAQEQVEKRSLASRKQSVEYDNIINEQRSVIYRKRQQILTLNNFDDIDNVLKGFIGVLMDSYKDKPQQAVADLELQDMLNSGCTIDDIQKTITELLSNRDQRVFSKEKSVVSYYFNSYWKDYINSTDNTRLITNLVSYGQKNPRNAFKKKMLNRFLVIINEIAKDSIVQITRYISYACKVKASSESNTYAS